MKKLLAVFSISLCAFTPLYAADGTRILEQIAKNLTPESYDSYRKIINVEPSGRTKEYVYYTAKKGRDKIAGLFLSPASDKGRSTLRLGDNMWLYVPNVGKPIRITSLQSVIGGVFNNADILALDYSVEYNAEKVEPVCKSESHPRRMSGCPVTASREPVREWAVSHPKAGRYILGAYSGASRPPVPFHSGHLFNSIPATHSGGIRPPIPEQAGHSSERDSDAG